MSTILLTVTLIADGLTQRFHKQSACLQVCKTWIHHIQYLVKVRPSRAFVSILLQTYVTVISAGPSCGACYTQHWWVPNHLFCYTARHRVVWVCGVPLHSQMLCIDNLCLLSNMISWILFQIHSLPPPWTLWAPWLEVKWPCIYHTSTMEYTYSLPHCPY